MNEAEKRIAEDIKPVFPSPDIMCRSCEFKRPGVLGYRTAYCEKFPEGKPNGILFDGVQCSEYKDG